MKRDMDLARRLLQELEDDDRHKATLLSIEGYSRDTVRHHLEILADAGLVGYHPAESESYSRDSRLASRIMVRATTTPEQFRLTWEGHEFLEASRNDTTWNRAKETVIERTGGMGFDVLLHVLKSMAMNAVGLSN